MSRQQRGHADSSSSCPDFKTNLSSSRPLYNACIPISTAHERPQSFPFPLMLAACKTRRSFRRSFPCKRPSLGLLPLVFAARKTHRGSLGNLVDELNKGEVLVRNLVLCDVVLDARSDLVRRRRVLRDLLPRLDGESDVRCIKCQLARYREDRNSPFGRSPARSSGTRSEEHTSELQSQ